MRKKKVGLFFGSFNPIHVGHLIIANAMLNETDLDQVWFVVSPQNPFKKKSSLLNEVERLRLVDLAIEDNLGFKSSNIEFTLPKPSYTIDTLAHLEERKGEHFQFSLIMGSDNLVNFHKWKNHEEILKNYELFVYNRPGSEETAFHSHNSVTLVESPLMHISATFIRNNIKQGKSVRYLLAEIVNQEIEAKGYYK